jgi:hypothetical protein
MHAALGLGVFSFLFFLFAFCFFPGSNEDGVGRCSLIFAKMRLMHLIGVIWFRALTEFLLMQFVTNKR